MANITVTLTILQVNALEATYKEPAAQALQKLVDDLANQKIAHLRDRRQREVEGEALGAVPAVTEAEAVAWYKANPP